MPNHYLGIDIRTDGIKAVMIRSRLKSATVAGQWDVSYPDGMYSPKNLTAALETIAETADIDGCECAVCFPAAWGYLRQVVLPFREKKKIDQVLSFEMEPLLPVPVDGVLTDYQIAEADETNTVLMTAAVEKSRLTAVIGSLGTRRLNPGILSFGGYPTLSLLRQHLNPEEDALFVLPAAANTAVFLLVGNQVVLVRNLYEDMTAQSPQQMADNLRRIVYSFQDGKTGKAFTPKRLYLSECSGLAPSLSEALSNLLGFPVQWLHPGRMPGTALVIDNETPALEDLPADALALAVCCIKGFEGVNFRKGPFAVSQFWQENRKSLIAPAVLGLLILMLAGYRSIVAIQGYQSRLDNINRQITQTFKGALPEVQRIVQPVHQMRVKLAEMKQETPQFAQNNQPHRVIDMLHAISERIAGDVNVVLSQLVIGPEAILLSGDADTFNTVNMVQQRLEQDPAFKIVSISSANQQKSGNRVNFKIRIQL